MKKTVVINGIKTKVDFHKHSYVRTHESDNTIAGFCKYNINGIDYTVSHISTRGNSGKMNKTLNYNGVPFADNEKSVIEHILNN